MPAARQNKRIGNGKQQFVWKPTSPSTPSSNSVAASASALLGAATCIIAAAAATTPADLVKQTPEDVHASASDGDSTEMGEDSFSGADEADSCSGALSDSGTNEGLSHKRSSSSVESEVSSSAIFSRAFLLGARRHEACITEAPEKGRLTTAARPFSGPSVNTPPSSPAAGAGSSATSPHAALVAAPSPTSWAAARRMRQKESAADERSDGGEVATAVRRSVKSILNKLTVEKFDTLYTKLLESGIRAVEHAELLAQELFEKATMQHNFSCMYADLCSRLLFDLGAVSPALRQALLQHCEILFQSSLLSAEEAEAVTSKTEVNDSEAEEDKGAMRKKRMLGNARFMGELFVRGVAPPEKLFEHTTELLKSPVTPEHLEIIVVILTVVGPVFDCVEWLQHDQLRTVFSQLQGMTFDPAVPRRVKCLIKDVFDLRESGWVETKRALKVAAPTSLKEVKAQAKVPIVSSPAASKSSKSSTSSSTPPVSPAANLPFMAMAGYGEEWHQATCMPGMVFMPMAWVPVPMQWNGVPCANASVEAKKDAEQQVPTDSAPRLRKGTRLMNKKVAVAE